MKTKIGLALLAVLALLNLSCSYFEGIFKDPLVGTWKVVYATQVGSHVDKTEVITFTAKGTFTITDTRTSTGDTIETWTGTYTDDSGLDLQYKTENGSRYSYHNHLSYDFDDDGKLWICWNDKNDISSYYTKQP